MGFAHFAPACSRLMRAAKPGAAAIIFIAACAVSERLPSAQSAIEGDVPLAWQLPARLTGLLLVVVQTLSLASTARSMLWHLRWPAKYLMGSYLLNLNFLDAFFISPAVRWYASQLWVSSWVLCGCLIQLPDASSTLICHCATIFEANLG